MPREAEEQGWEPLVLEEDCIVSAAVSQDGSRLLLNMSTRAVHLWKIPALNSQESAVLLQKLRGAKERQSRCPSNLFCGYFLKPSGSCFLCNHHLLSAVQICGALLLWRLQ